MQDIIDKGKAMHWFYYFGRFVIGMLLLLLTRWRVVGKENIPGQGPLLIVANHLSLADPPVLGASIRRKAVFMAKEELFRPRFTGYFIRNFGAFPVHRGQLDREAIRQAGHWVSKGIALIMFPEGARSKSAQLQPAFPGSALIASRIGAAILPVGITGTENIRGLTWWLRRPGITVNIGHPFHPPQEGARLAKAERARLTDFIMGRIAELLPPEYRGTYNGEGHDKA